MKYDWDYAVSEMRLKGMPFGWLRANLYAEIANYWRMFRRERICGRCHTEQEFRETPWKVHVGNTNDRTQLGWSEHECVEGEPVLIFQTLSFTEEHPGFDSRIQEYLD